MLVYATHTGTQGHHRADGRQFLTRHGFRVAVMKADAVAPERREAWVAEQGEAEGIDVMICHPQAGADRPRPHRLPDPLLVRDRVLCLPINTKGYGSHGRSIWMQLGVE